MRELTLFSRVFDRRGELTIEVPGKIQQEILDALLPIFGYILTLLYEKDCL